MPSRDEQYGIRRSGRSPHRVLCGQHRFEHWYRDNQVYFITARCRDGFPAFETPEASEVFWDRFEHYTTRYNFTPWVTCLLNNHYHTVGYLSCGEDLPQMMRRLHGSVAKMVNDVLSERRVPFWRGDDGHDYFDGCLRDEKQGRRTYLSVLRQPTRHGLCADWRSYGDLRIDVDLEDAIADALERSAFLEGVLYKRYEGRKKHRH